MRLLFWTLLLFMMWLILSANLQMANVLVGVVVSFCIALLYSKLFTHSKFESVNPVWLMVYLWVLLKNLAISNYNISRRVLRKDMKLSPAIIEVKTSLQSDWKKLLLANSITLTPGTLTLEVKEESLYIHLIEYYDGDSKEAIIKEFEEVIVKI
ncbi:MAG: Na+/H+ antiporter subunit E [Campylobacterota bacterium]|nr:Na+/H+ antiporter subunit E [Campylobacterota bacterium]